MKFTTEPVGTVHIRVEIDDAGDAIVLANDCEVLCLLQTGQILLNTGYRQLEELGFAVNNRGQVVIV